jgi:hypothetical protein
LRRRQRWCAGIAPRAEALVAAFAVAVERISAAFVAAAIVTPDIAVTGAVVPTTAIRRYDYGGSCPYYSYSAPHLPLAPFAPLAPLASAVPLLVM